MTTPSWLKGDLEIRKRLDETGGNLSVEGTITVEGNVTAPNLSYSGHTHTASDVTEGVFDPDRLPAATDSSPGAVTLVTAEGLDGAAASDELVPTFAAAEEIAGAALRSIPKGAGTTTYGLVRLDSPSGLKLSGGNLKFSPGTGLVIEGGNVDVLLRSDGGLDADAGGLFIHTAKAKALLSLGTASALDSAGNLGTGEDAGKVPVLNDEGKLSNAVIPKYSITHSFVRKSEEEMLALGAAGAEEGDICIRRDVHRNFFLNGADPADPANWVDLEVPSDLIATVRAEVLDIVAGAYVTTSAMAAAFDTNLTAIANTYATKAELTAGINAIQADYATTASVTAAIGSALDTVAGTYITQEQEAEALAALAQVYSPLGHTHPSADLTDTVSAGSGITAAETKIPQAKAVFDFVDSIVLRDELTPLPGTEIELIRATEGFFKEVAGDVTLTLDASGVSMSPGERVEFLLYLVVTGEGSVTLPDWSWAGGAPDLSVPGTHLITVFTIDGGWQWIASAQSYAYPQSQLLHRARILPAPAGGAASVVIEDAFVEYHLPVTAESLDDGELTVTVDTSNLAFDPDDETRRGFFAEIFLEISPDLTAPARVTLAGHDRWMDFGHLKPRLAPGNTYVLQVFSFDAGETIAAAFVEERYA